MEKYQDWAHQRVIFVLTNEFIIANNYLSPINAVFIIVNVFCSPAFILKKSIVSEPSVLLTAAALTGNSQKRKEWRKKRAKQTWRRLRNFYMAIFISKFFQTAQSTEPKLVVSTVTLNCLITGVLRSYDCTVPIKERYMLLLNSLLDFAYNNAINRD